MTVVGSRRRQRKALVRNWLAAWELPQLVAAAGGDPAIASTLITFLVETDNQLRWRAIHALGLVAAVRAKQGLEPVRDLLRRQFWAMNDDSGNVLQHGPEAVAEVLFRVPAVRFEYAANLFAHFQTPMFRAGVAWGMARLAGPCPSLLTDYLTELAAAVRDREPSVRGHAAVALATVGVLLHPSCSPQPTQRLAADELEGALDQLCEDGGLLEVFDAQTGNVAAMTVGALVRLCIGDRSRNVDL